MLIRIFMVVMLVMSTACSNDSATEPAAGSATESATESATDAATEPVSMGTNTFLADNAAQENVVVTDTGLQYEVLRAAEGPKPSAQSTVTVHYVGELVDGTQFDSSFSRGQPFTTVLNRTILGWVEGVQLMSVGSQYRFVIPPELAYGERGSPPNIGPNATLVFIVDLLEINSS